MGGPRRIPDPITAAPTRRDWSVVAACVVLVGPGFIPTPVLAQADRTVYRNLRVLPPDIGQGELGEIMLENLRGLGLARRAGEGCLHCHVGSTDVHRDEWDYASDDNPAKEKARVMMAMVRELNARHLASLSDRSEPRVEVTCYTCHAGRINPMPLPDLLMAEYAGGGLEALGEAYRAARARYYAADAYDFRVGVLIEVAARLAEEGLLEDAARVHELNLEYHDDASAHSGLVQLRLVQALDSDGPEGMTARLRELDGQHPADAFAPEALGALGWRLFRAGRYEPALLLFERHFAEHPESFTAAENLAYAVFDSGDEERGLEIAERWTVSHPSHDGGRVLLDELQRRRRE